MRDRGSQPFFIFEMANNHMGDVEHGLRIIDALAEVARDFPFRFAIKLQYRDIDTFVHPDYRERFDLKFVKRFTQTRLSWEEYKRLKDAIAGHGMATVCTPWDEVSVDRIVEHAFDIVKIPSCYLTDWPLLERIALTDMPLIASTAGASLENIDKVVTFFRNRNKQLSLMHCVGEYPTGDANLNLSQIALLGARYPAVPIGYSTHERPDNYDAVKVAIGIGARIFEKHVGVETDSVKLNGYSANPQQVRRWLEAASTALTMCGAGGERYAVTAAEAATLRDLQRGVFARRELRPGATLRAEDVFFAIPGAEGQVRANDMSKYTSFELTQPLAPNQPVLFSGVNASNTQARLYRIISDVKKLLRRSKVVVPGQLELEISHHYGIDQFEKTGSTIITVVNREYCKRIIVMLAGQRHPEQHHRQKDETYHLLFGEITLTLDDVQRKVRANEVVVIPRGTRHGFFTGTGAVIEEVSSYYTQGDSFYTDPAIEANKNRKTWVTYWMG